MLDSDDDFVYGIDSKIFQLCDSALADFFHLASESGRDGQKVYPLAA
jgi:hypothetical protein